MPNRPRPTVPILLFGLVLPPLAGCASQQGFPSLEPRPIEAIARRPERTTTVAPAAPAPALLAQIDRIAAALDANAASWNKALGEVRSIVGAARGRPVGDERWVAAQQAISRLEPLRQASGALVEDLDALRLQQAQSPTPIDTGRLDTLWSRGVAQVESQSTAYRAVVAILPTG
jgi:hypothetical protein